MSGMCCGVVGEAETPSTPVEPNTSKRKRLEVPPLKFLATDAAAASVVVIPQENFRKKQKLKVIAAQSSSPSRECVNSVQNSAESGSSEVKVSTGDDMEVKSHTEIDHDVAKDTPRFGMTSVCGRRRDMEDEVAIHPSFARRGEKNSIHVHFFGVYDGHGCSHVATRCKERFHEIVKDVLVDGHETSWTEVMKSCYSLMDEEVGQNFTSGSGVSSSNCRCELQTPRCDAVGSTAVISLVTPDKLIVSNCGDSRAVLCRNGVAFPLSSDHKPDRPDELHRIESAGGRVIYWDGARVLGVLAMSRAIGDSYLKPFVISDPEVTVTDRTSEDECLILASDGLWDVISNETACNVARMCLRSQKPSSPPRSPSSDAAAADVRSDKACTNASILLTKLALARHSTDNVSVVVVDLRREQ